MAVYGLITGRHRYSPEGSYGGQIVEMPVIVSNKANPKWQIYYEDTGCFKNPHCIDCPYPVSECPTFIGIQVAKRKVKK